MTSNIDIESRIDYKMAISPAVWYQSLKPILLFYIKNISFNSHAVLILKKLKTSEGPAAVLDNRIDIIVI